MIPILAIPGTWAWRGSSDGQWYDPSSPWSAYIRGHGFDHLRGPDRRPFVWTTDVNGQQFWRRWFGRKPCTTDWQCGGQNLYAWLVPPLAPDRCQPPSMTHLVAHSHGLQVALFACADGLKVNTLISIGSPVRSDMIEVARRARPNIGYWLHLHSDGSDRMQWFGEIGDGAFRIVRAHPLADINHALPEVGHSEILNDSRRFSSVWPYALDIIKQRHGRSDAA
jgi:hypothetical protein